MLQFLSNVNAQKMYSYQVYFLCTSIDVKRFVCFPFIFWLSKVLLAIIRLSMLYCSTIKSIWKGGSEEILSGKVSLMLALQSCPLSAFHSESLYFQVPKVRTVNYDLN